MIQALVGGGDKKQITTELCNMIGTKPEVLVIPSAARTDAIQENNFARAVTLMSSLGIAASSVVELHPFNTDPEEQQIIDRFLSANLIYICGGNYGVLASFLERNPTIKKQLDNLPERKDVGLYGASSGAIIQCAMGQSQPVGNDIQSTVDWDYQLVNGLALGAASRHAVCVHANKYEDHPNGSKLREEHFLNQPIPSHLSRLILPNGIAYITPSDALPQGKFVASTEAIEQGITGRIV